MKYIKNFLKIFFLLIFSNINISASEPVYDVVIYGGSSSGIAAAIQVKRMGKTVIVIEPGTRIGGLTTGGLGQTDIGNKAAIGGISREFYENIATYYSKDENWKWQKREEYKDGGQTRTEEGENSMWTFEPSAALSVMQEMVNMAKVEIVYSERLNRNYGVEMKNGNIISITMESGRTFAGKMFIDATYEGDLLATAGISYTVGRESNKQYNETINGVQVAQAKYHNFVDGVDPYIKKGDPKSGLLPYISQVGIKKDGAGDKRIQAYCFRMCITDNPDNRIPFEKPEGYIEVNYELLLRNYEAGEKGLPWINSAMPNKKTDTNNRLGFSTDFIGQNYNYPEASYEEREEIIKRHLEYQKGLMWTLAYHPRMPKHIRDEVSRWGTCKDEFERKDGWQKQLYIREARRMVGEYVMTQHNCEGREVVKDVVGLGAYGMDSHHTQRYVNKDGYVKNEGDVQVHVDAPYPISYRSLIPKAKECNNLFSSICISASHIAYGSIRMEPVFMVLGQSAATAACLAIDKNVSVQDLDYSLLKSKLLEDKQHLVWKE